MPPPGRHPTTLRGTRIQASPTVWPVCGVGPENALERSTATALRRRKQCVGDGSGVASVESCDMGVIMSTRDEIQRQLPRGARRSDGAAELAGLVVEAPARDA